MLYVLQNNSHSFSLAKLSTEALLIMILKLCYLYHSQMNSAIQCRAYTIHNIIVYKVFTSFLMHMMSAIPLFPAFRLSACIFWS